MEKDWQIKISEWLETLSFQSIKELWEIAQGLKERQEELDEHSFEVPYDKLNRIRGDLKSWLINLHKKNIASIWTNPPYKKNKVGSISVGTPINDDEHILSDPTTQIELNIERFEYLYSVLKLKLTENNFKADVKNSRIDNVEKRIEKIEKYSREKMSPKQIVSKILKLYPFPKKQKKLIRILSDEKPKRTKELTQDIKTKDLVSLKRDTQAKIKSFKLNNIIMVKSIKGSGGFPEYFYKMEVNQQEFFRTNETK